MEINDWVDEVDQPAKPVVLRPKTEAARNTAIADVFNPQPEINDWTDEPPQQKVSTVKDVLKSVGSGLVEGGASMAMSLPNLINEAVAGPQMLGRGIADTVSPMLGAPAQPRGELWKPFYGSSDVVKAAGLDYDPQTTAGNVAKVPAMIAGGLTTAKAMSSPKLGQGLKDIVKSETSGSQIPPKAPALTADDVKAVATKAYSYADKVGGVLKPEFTDKMLSEIDAAKPSLIAGKVHTAEDKKFINALDDFKELKGSKLTLSDYQRIDEALGDKIDDMLDAGRITKSARKVIDIQSKLRSMLDDVSDTDVIGGKEGFKALEAGRITWSSAAKMRDIEKILTRAEMTQNPDTAIKTGFRNLYMNDSRMRGYDPETKALIKKAAETGVVSDLLSVAGSRLFPMITSATGTGGLGGAMAAQAGSMAARNLKTKVQVGRANKVAESVANQMRKKLTDVIQSSSDQNITNSLPR